jgi:zinc finger HIT domain-containing protein 3
LSATSHAVRTALTRHPELKDLLRSIDGLWGSARENALQACLGVSPSDVTSSGGGGTGTIVSGIRGIQIGEEEKEGMRELAEAIEAAVRGNREDGLGLDWGQN